ncbi:hypothetical protein NGM36_01780 [Streptomyces mutabilis]|uniref:hypothetical protein n=1 Tax=Streptomyces mutabilis TaxID=67332 RepID=UPI0022BA71D1|nr:hypothetical protein [Streptomyces mutabilis]MCZ9348547.1 hypothetical protein [Streptomyces mutabilis]
MRLPRWLLPHRISVEPYAGDSAYGPTYGPPIEDVRALVDLRIRVVRNREGREVTSTATVYAEPELAAQCPPESLITLPDGRITHVIAVAPHTAPGMGLPESTEVACE